MGVRKPDSHYLHGIDCIGELKPESKTERVEDKVAWASIGIVAIGIVALFHWMKD